MKMFLRTECSEIFDSFTRLCAARHDVARDGGGESKNVADEVENSEEVRPLTNHQIILRIRVRRVSVHAGIKHVNKKVYRLVEHYGAYDCTSTHTSNNTSSTSRTSSRTSSCSFLQLFLSLQVSTLPTMRVRRLHPRVACLSARRARLPDPLASRVPLVKWWLWRRLPDGRSGSERVC